MDTIVDSTSTQGGDHLQNCNGNAQSSSEEAQAHFCRSMELLRQGHYEEGWREYRWRKQCHWPNSNYPHRLAEPPWNNEPLSGKRLLIHSEQGYGDVFQCLRYLKLLKQRGATIVFEVRDNLACLLKRHPHIDELLTYADHRPPQTEYDYYVSIMDLPGLMGTTLQTIPPSEPRLSISKELETQWQFIRDEHCLNVGIAFSGTPYNPINPQRSCPVALFKPLSRIPGVRLLSLQKGTPTEQLADLDWDLMDIGTQCRNFADTAGVIKHLDLVISVCTSVAHLAGIMHKPLWVLLHHHADWRWHVNTSTSPWYPTAHLFRQSRAGAWVEVIERVTQALADRVRRHISQGTCAGESVLTQV